eukprot:scaffold203_cov98-Skeletonema_dohrnii-CCMP3373.AAC.8
MQGAEAVWCRQYGIFILQSVLSALAQRSLLVSLSPPHAKRLSFSEYALALYRLQPGLVSTTTATAASSLACLILSSAFGLTPSVGFEEAMTTSVCCCIRAEIASMDLIRAKEEHGSERDYQDQEHESLGLHLDLLTLRGTNERTRWCVFLLAPGYYPWMGMKTCCSSNEVRVVPGQGEGELSLMCVALPTDTNSDVLVEVQQNSVLFSSTSTISACGGRENYLHRAWDS